MNTAAIFAAMLLTLVAGLSTGIGGLLSMFHRQSSSRFLSLSLGFSAGVMVYLSFLEILPESIHFLSGGMSETAAEVQGVIVFFMGVAIVALIDRFVPSRDNPHEIPNVINMVEHSGKDIDIDHHLLRTGILSAIAITIHNIPEGLATFTSYLAEPQIGVSIAIAIAIHNIPEGIAVAVPIYFATGRRGKAFLIALLSGLSEMAGAVIGLVLIRFSGTELMVGYVLAATAGIMVYISFDELLPTAERYGEHIILL